MKIFLPITFVTLCAFQSHAGVSLSRSWSRDTLSTSHIGFRHHHTMSPVLTDRLVIQGNGTDAIGAYSRRTGALRWQRSFKNGVEGGAIVDGERLYFGAGDGHFYSVNVKTGKTVWKQPISSESLASPSVSGNLVFFLAGNNSLFAFDKDSGRPLWVKTRPLKATMTLRGVTQPTIKNGIVYVGYSDGHVSAFEAVSGREMWSQRIGDGRKFNDVDASPRVAGNCVLVSSFENALHCLDIQTGRSLWRHDHGAYRPVTVRDNQIYLPTSQGQIHILDLKSGKLQRKVLLGKKGLSTEVVFASGYMFHGESRGSLVVRDPQSLQVLDQFDPGKGIFARPTVDEEKGEVYFLSNQGNLYELALLQKRGDFPWRRKTQF